MLLKIQLDTPIAKKEKKNDSIGKATACSAIYVILNAGKAGLWTDICKVSANVWLILWEYNVCLQNIVYDLFEFSLAAG